MDRKANILYDVTHLLSSCVGMLVACLLFLSPMGTLSAQQTSVMSPHWIELTTNKSDAVTVKLAATQEGSQITLQRGSWTQSEIVGTKAKELLIEGSGSKIEIIGSVSTLTCTAGGITSCVANQEQENHPLKKLILSQNEITSFSIASFPELSALSLQACGLERIDLSVGSRLTNINLNDNKLQELDLSGCPLLTRVQFANNGLDACALDKIYATLPTLHTPASKVNLINAKSNDTNEAKTSNTAIAVGKNWRPQTPGDGSGCLPPQITLETRQRTEQIYYLRSAESGPVSFDIDWGDGHLQHYEMMQETSGARLEVKGTPLGDKLTFFGDWIHFEANGAGITAINTSYAPNLIALYLRRNDLTELDLSNNPKLLKLYLRGNQLSSINLESTPLLEELYIRENNLKSIDLSSVPALRELALSHNPLKAPIDLSHTPRLVKLYLGGLGLNQIDLSSCPELYQFEAERNHLESIDISHCRKIGIIKIAHNNFNASSLTELYQSLPKPDRKVDWINLTIEENPGATTSYTDIAIAHGWRVDVAGDGSGALALPPHLLLETKRGYYDKINLKAQSRQPLQVWGATLTESGEYQLYASKILIVGEIEELNVAKSDLVKLTTLHAPSLEKLDCSENHLESLDVSSFKALKTLLCFRNKLTHLTLTGCRNLEWLSCTDNVLTELDLSGLSRLKILFCTFNKLTSLSTEGLTGLTLLDCGANRIKSLDLSKAPAIRELDCSNNKVLDDLSLQGCQSLASLDCSGNALTHLSLEGLTRLEQLRCYRNRLTELDFSSSSRLKAVALDCNQIGEYAMDRLLQTLPQRSATQRPAAEIRVLDLKNPSEANVCLQSSVGKAQKKNWLVMAFNGERDIPYEGTPSGIVTLPSKGVESPLFYPTITDGIVRLSDSAQQMMALSPLDIYNLCGEHILRIASTSRCQEIDLSTLPYGAYLLALGGYTAIITLH